MKLVFHKYHGTGNDFILVDNQRGNIRLSQEQIARYCDRHFGIGADGFLLLTARPGYDFGMVYFNSDGNESTMCGNGGRCMVAYVRSLNLIKDKATFMASDGEHRAEVLKINGSTTHIRLKMSDVLCTPPPTPPQQGRGATVSSREPSTYLKRSNSIQINTGSPHFVVFVDDVSTVDVVKEGRMLRNDPRFVPDGINVDFVEIRDNGLFVRTYERGVENETLSCGTGVTAAALAVASWQLAVGSWQRPVTSHQSPVTGHQSPLTSYAVETLGGKLTVSFRQRGGDFTDIWLEGPAEFVFSGKMTNFQ
ncbi:MAG: diaminopimelate epimerase [bacterium]